MADTLTPTRPTTGTTGARAGRAARSSIAILAFLALWELVPRIGLVDSIFLPPASRVATTWLELALDGQLWENLGASLARALSGFAIALLIAVPLGLVIGWYRTADELLTPLLEVFRNTAALALLPVFVLLLGLGETSKISLIVFACVWPILLNTISAVRTVDPLLIKSARSLGFGSAAVFGKVVLPASVPTVFTGIRLAAAGSILVLVAAEMVGAKAGLGYLINAAQYNFEVPQMYAGIVTISLLGIAFNHALTTVEGRLSRWRS
ncbi:ABC transporter permease [Saccharopolyspora sp. TS4A08]|uniref:ABC transporter permease n=1 Tax=Saccharopolyspora ipomoeae TaxID=3042027 RepID=A0ABT6PJK5_9PSEU|nr:ABC transporter permease [Saccharopolyspora sp. TS4A08]MDI2027833.1 ABC transporter permease [Saccharopolyspora sp. TS4A08]